MGRIQFRQVWGQEVVIERKNGDTIVGYLSGEDGLFVYLNEATLVRNGQKIPSSYLAIHKKAIAILRTKGGGMG